MYSKDESLSALGQNRSQHLSVHIGQAEVAASVGVGQVFVIKAHKVEDGGVRGGRARLPDSPGRQSRTRWTVLPLRKE